MGAGMRDFFTLGVSMLSVGAVLASKTAEMTTHDAIRIILSDKKSYPTSLNYATEYCRVGLYQPLGSDDLRVQCLHILNNIQKWRHPEAKTVRSILKKEAGIK